MSLSQKILILQTSTETTKSVKITQTCAFICTNSNEKYAKNGKHFWNKVLKNDKYQHNKFTQNICNNLITSL